MRNKTLGFSLVELLMVTALIAILVMLALPDYRTPITRIERVAAGVCLLEIATRFEGQRASQQGQASVELYADEGGCEEALVGSYLFAVNGAGSADWHISAETLVDNSTVTEQCERLVFTQQGQRGVKAADGTLDFSEQALDCW
ncbi:prepilin-type N-terminal cleavage/methylation domain-containing protein [Spiribacter sp. C176]|uniref:Prepilin-type N-terminal cleavage/methylation domain-containing protein n=1 Tax=Spiribacter salilacus TaxID=2664894 RepID=A0A6N7R174_9GAMM|nr:prepilin-type N-terminal cleavage/methylation domain-containing protein [Spiribacter salilacus]MRH78714.1 prepilin-type N-terminal cleavage/methylation domain-containing protein [Spiribacter salilacus]